MQGKKKKVLVSNLFTQTNRSLKHEKTASVNYLSKSSYVLKNKAVKAYAYWMLLSFKMLVT